MWRSFDWRKQRIAPRGEIIRNKTIFSCAFCNGRGELPSAKGLICQVCRGEGIVHVKGPVIICAYCNGTGKQILRSQITCSVCRGKGIVEVCEPVEICPQCKGKGRVRGFALPCLLCRGKGVISKKK